MAYLVKLPPLGEGIFEAQMIAVHKKVGDEVKEGDPIAEMETDKAVGVLAAPVDGVIEEFYREQYDYIFRDEKVLLIDDGKEDLTTGTGADGGRVNEDGSVSEPDPDEKLATTVDSQSSEKKVDNSSKEKDQKTKEQNHFAHSMAKEAEDHSYEGSDEDHSRLVHLADEEGLIPGKDYHIVESSGSAMEIFKRFRGEEQEEAGGGDKPDPEFMAQQGQAQQGEPKPAKERKHRYLDPLQSNFHHSNDGSQPIPTHISNELPYEELIKRGQEVKAVPAVRQYAAEQGLDISLLPVNEEGVITKEEVDRALSHRVGEREWNYRKVDEMDPGYYTDRPEDESGREETYIRKYNASRFEMTHHKVPPFSVGVKIDMSQLMQYLSIRKGEEADSHDYIPYLIKAICVAAYRYPELNSSIDDDVSVFRFREYVNVGIEMNTVQGLFTPVVKDAQAKSIEEVEQRVDELEYEVKRERIFNYETNSDSTITISDLSKLGPVETYTPMIHYPDAAIIGLSNVRDEVVVEDGDMVVKPLKPMTLVMDSRILTRDKGVRIANFIKDMLEKPSYLFQMIKEINQAGEEDA